MQSSLRGSRPKGAKDEVKRPEGLQLEVGAPKSLQLKVRTRKAPRLLVFYKDLWGLFDFMIGGFAQDDLPDWWGRICNGAVCYCNNGSLFEH